MRNSKLVDLLQSRKISVTLENILNNSKANSGGDRDLNFVKYLIDNKLLVQTEAILKRAALNLYEEYYLERYKKMSLESDRHFLCRTIIQDELKRMNIDTIAGIDVGNMNILRANSNYDIVADDFGCIIDVGLTPARNYFRGLTDLNVKNYLVTTYYDDYMDDIIFCVFTRSNDENYFNAIRDYEEGFKQYIPAFREQLDESNFYRH